jgi:putative NIF3 family GTP cyclohydrolase 1 type 2
LRNNNFKLEMILLVLLSELENSLDLFFDIERFGKDPGFSRFIPQVYDAIAFDWRKFFEDRFCHIYNGLMIRGAENVKKIFLAVFPTDEVLERFINESSPGDFLFMHHPLLMECGDPKGFWGRGFVPINEEYLRLLKKKRLSVYTCHVPLDIHSKISTNLSIAKAIEAEVIDDFFHTDYGPFGLIGIIQSTNTNDIINHLKQIFEVPYVDFEGKHHSKITKVAIIAGCGDVVEAMSEAEKKGAQAYITGEIHCHIDNEYGREKFRRVMEYVQKTNMSLIGVSHSASEYLVMKTLMKEWISKQFDVEIVLLPQKKWWL